MVWNIIFSVLASVLGLPVLECLLAAMAGVHSLLAWGPFAGANLTVLFVILECLHKAENLIHITAYGEIVVLHVSENTLPIDDESGAEMKSIISCEASIVATKLLSEVSEHGNLHAAEATLLTRLVGKLLVSEMGVN